MKEKDISKLIEEQNTEAKKRIWARIKEIIKSTDVLPSNGGAHKNKKRGINSKKTR